MDKMCSLRFPLHWLWGMWRDFWVYSEGGDSKLLRNIGINVLIYMSLHPRRLEHPSTSVWKPKFSQGDYCLLRCNILYRDFHQSCSWLQKLLPEQHYKWNLHLLETESSFLPLQFILPYFTQQFLKCWPPASNKAFTPHENIFRHTIELYVEIFAVSLWKLSFECCTCPPQLTNLEIYEVIIFELLPLIWKIQTSDTPITNQTPNLRTWRGISWAFGSWHFPILCSSSHPVLETTCSTGFLLPSVQERAVV